MAKPAKPAAPKSIPKAAKPASTRLVQVPVDGVTFARLLLKGMARQDAKTGEFVLTAAGDRTLLAYVNGIASPAGSRRRK